MFSTFNIEKLNALLQDFYELTHMRITIFDDHFHELTSYPAEVPPICRFLRQHPEAAAGCHACDRRASKYAGERKSPYIYQCHAGLTEAVTPVYMGSILIAYLWFGHLFSYDTQIQGWMSVRHHCRRYNLDEAQLKELVMGMALTPRQKIVSAAHILQAVASYLCIDRMITLHQQDLSWRIDEYINAHFTEEMGVQALCDTFHIGKTALYDIARQSYGCGIAEHIRRLRLAHAKKLLTDNPELTIAQVAADSGFGDYNYFITVFRKATGRSPLQYRKAMRQAEKQPRPSS